MPPAEVEDISQEMQELNSAVTQLEELAGTIENSAGGGEGNPSSGENPIGGPIVHGENIPTPLAGESGTTSGGTPLVEQPQPGTNPTDGQGGIPDSPVSAQPTGAETGTDGPQVTTETGTSESGAPSGDEEDDDDGMN